jgi:hypothetical protein
MTPPVWFGNNATGPNRGPLPATSISAVKTASSSANSVWPNSRRGPTLASNAASRCRLVRPTTRPVASRTT